MLVSVIFLIFVLVSVNSIYYTSRERPGFECVWEGWGGGGEEKLRESMIVKHLPLPAVELQETHNIIVVLPEPLFTESDGL